MTEWQTGLIAVLLGVIAYQTWGLADEARRIHARLCEIAALLKGDSTDL